jgi:hypothetical protein
MGKGVGSRERFCGTFVLVAHACRGKLRFLGHTGSGFTIDQLGEIVRNIWDPWNDILENIL